MNVVRAGIAVVCSALSISERITKFHSPPGFGTH
jgi:hypothetical protein